MRFWPLERTRQMSSGLRAKLDGKVCILGSPVPGFVVRAALSVFGIESKWLQGIGGVSVSCWGARGGLWHPLWPCCSAPQWWAQHMGAPMNRPRPHRQRPRRWGGGKGMEKTPHAAEQRKRKCEHIGSGLSPFFFFFLTFEAPTAPHSPNFTCPALASLALPLTGSSRCAELSWQAFVFF